jgi:hypothetical protein
MKCNFTNYLFLSSILFGLLDLGFFLYGSITLTDMAHYRFNIHCVEYFDYCSLSNLVFLGSIVVVASFVCSKKYYQVMPFVLFISNIFLNIGIGVHNFLDVNRLCNSECEAQCQDLVTYGNNFTIFMITNLSCLGVILLCSLIFVCK